jgi:DNA recombination protein RmuC
VIVAFTGGLLLGVLLAVLLLRARRTDEADLLGRFETEMRRLEAEREQLGGDLRARIETLGEEHARAAQQTAQLAGALRHPGVGGRWGENTLKNVVEAAGLAEHVDYTQQLHIPADGERPAARPDLVIRLPGGGRIAVDSKVPLDAYLDAVRTDDEAVEARLLDEHVARMRARVAELAGKAYWRRLEHAPEMVVMFVGSEAAVSAAAQRDPRLLSDAVGRRVMIATPVTMSALLQLVALGWREDAIGRKAEEVRRLGVELCGRLETFASHLARTSKGLEAAVGAHNDAVGSYERRLLPTIRRIGERGIAEAERADAPPLVEQAVRLPAPAPERPLPAVGRLAVEPPRRRR